MTSLRTLEGTGLDIINKRFGHEYTDQILQNAQKYLQDGRMINNKNILVLTKEGKLYADGIASDLFAEEDSKKETH
jgi:oxygen-independent coproporphyrinogen-3 oxidase